ncbi:hypothetical protein HC725_02985 [Vibrio sp. S17_S38]|uniref:hypothetical protein n=1 Tax=Vibrio sp. S17_S38 TaxID=2720229 RepID=UPI0016806424|nr:hypothetical protein [Vibrio sp. S17_S38]MBD1572248.1 hypothetical protein [Vibrio sp. S17_S38]
MIGNKCCFFFVIVLSGCSAMVDSVDKYTGDYDGKYLGEYMIFPSPYYTTRIFNNPEYIGNSPSSFSVESYSYKEMTKDERFFHKYYFTDLGENAIELPAKQMWHSKRQGKHFFPRLAIGYSERSTTQEERDNVNRFRDSYTYQKKNGQYVKFDYLEAYAAYEKKRIPVQFCQSDGWCKTYIRPMDYSSGAFVVYDAKDTTPTSRILYELDNALYVKRSDIYPPWETEESDNE